MSQNANTDLYALAVQAVENKGYPSAEIKEEMVQEVMRMIEDTINLELLSRMTKEQIDDFNALLEDDSTDDEAITNFINACGIDIDIATSVALTKFRIGYLGA